MFSKTQLRFCLLLSNFPSLKPISEDQNTQVDFSERSQTVIGDANSTAEQEALNSLRGDLA